MIVKFVNDLLTGLPRMENHLHKHDGMRLEHLADQHLAADGRHGALDIGRRGAGRKVLR